MANERILVLDLTNPGRVAAWAREAYLVVGVGDLEQVRAARRACAELDNVMFVEGTRAEIPWQPGFFDVIVDPGEGETTPAMTMAMALGGRIVREF